MKVAPAPSQDPFVGTPYRVLRTLDSEGPRRRYLVEHEETGRRCVAQVLPRSRARDAEQVERLLGEARALGQLRHPHIVEVVGVGFTSGALPFLITEHLQGLTLAEELATREGPLPVLEAVAYAWQTCAALGFAHRAGIVHCNIEPGSLFLCERAGGGRVVKVVDFSRACGAPPADPRNDLHDAGVVLSRMLTAPGRSAPFPIPVELERLVSSLLEENPAERLQTAREICAELEGIGLALAGPVGWAKTVGFAPEERPDEAVVGAAEDRGEGDHRSRTDAKVRPESWRRPIVLFVVVALVALFVAMVGFWFWRSM